MFASPNTPARRIAPKHETWVPHKFQERAVDFLLDRGSAALFLDPGLGKTSITLKAFDELRKDNIAEKMLVIAPLRVCQLVWRQEADRWTEFRHLKFTMLHGPKKRRLLEEDSDIFLINPEGVPWLTNEFYKKRLPFDTLVFDELTRFKNAQAVRHKAIMPFTKHVARRWGLTGTPIPNGYMDLFGQMKVLDGGAALGYYFTHFRNKYFESDYSGFRYELRRGAAKKIEAAIQPYVLRMASEDYLELPPLIEDIRYVEMPKKARVQYETMKKEMIVELEGSMVEAGNAAAVYSKLKQMANGAVYSGGSLGTARTVVHLHDAKIEALEELIEELAGTPLIVAYEFNHDLMRLRKAIGADIPYIGAKVTEKQVKEIERAWNNNELPTLFAHPASAGHGLNFQKGNACHIAHFSTTWDYELYDQFIRRILRQGNKAARVVNHIFIVKNTIDTKTIKVIVDKGLTQDAFHVALNSEIYSDASPHEATTTAKEPIMPRLSRRATRKREDRETEIEDEAETETEDEDEDESEDEAPEPRRRKTRRKARKAQTEPEPEDEDEDEDDGDEEPEPRRRRTRTKDSSKKTKRKLRGKSADDDDDDDDEDEEPLAKKARRKFSSAVQKKLDKGEAKPAVEKDTMLVPTEIDYNQLARALLRNLGEMLIDSNG